VVSSTTAHKERLGRPKLHVFFFLVSLFIYFSSSLSSLLAVVVVTVCCFECGSSRWLWHSGEMCGKMVKNKGIS